MTYIPTRLERVIQVDSIITVHYFEYMKDFEFQGEMHNFWEFLCVDKGTVAVRARDTWYTLETGDVIFHCPNEFHAIKSIGKNAPNLMVMSFVSSSPAMDYFRRKMFCCTAEEKNLLSTIVAEAQDAFQTPIYIPSVEKVELNPTSAFGAQQIILNRLEMFLLLAMRNHIEGSGIDKKLVSAPQKRKVEEEELMKTICQSLMDRLEESVTIDDLCTHFSISRSVLQNMFHKTFGCGVIEYFNGMKVEQAKEFLREGEMNITEVSAVLGYNSLSYFSKQFKRYTGMCPSDYLESIKGISEGLKRHEK